MMTERTARLITHLERIGIAIQDKELLATIAERAHSRVEPFYTETEFSRSASEDRKINEQALDHLLRHNWSEIQNYIPAFLNRVLGVETCYLSEASRLFLFLFLIDQLHWLQYVGPGYSPPICLYSWEAVPHLIARLRNNPEDPDVIERNFPACVWLLCDWPAWMRERLEELHRN